MIIVQIASLLQYLWLKGSQDKLLHLLGQQQAAMLSNAVEEE